MAHPPANSPPNDTDPVYEFDTLGRRIRGYDRGSGHVTVTLYDAQGRRLSHPDRTNDDDPDKPFVVGG
jgi:hypothetical protein